MGKENQEQYVKVDEKKLRKDELEIGWKKIIDSSGNDSKEAIDAIKSWIKNFNTKIDKYPLTTAIQNDLDENLVLINKDINNKIDLAVTECGWDINKLVEKINNIFKMDLNISPINLDYNLAVNRWANTNKKTELAHNSQWNDPSKWLPN